MVNRMYRRYCDDIIVVLPMDNSGDNNNAHETYSDYIHSVSESIPNLELNKTKQINFSIRMVI